jgi:hypothetical protein
MLSILPGRARLSPKVREVVDLTLIKKRCVVRARLVISPSLRAAELRKNAGNESVLLAEPTPKKEEPDAQATEYQGSAPNGTRLRREEDHAEDGSTSMLSVDITAVPSQ